MGDPRHKKPPPSQDEEIVTDSFRRDARRALELNGQRNELAGLGKSDPGYLISNQAELAEEVGTSKRMIARIIGAVKPDTKIDLVDRSVYVASIRSLLGLSPVTQISVPVRRAEVLRLLSELPDREFEVFEQALRKPRRS